MEHFGQSLQDTFAAFLRPGARVTALTSKLHAENGESADVEKSQGAAEAREGRTEGVRPSPQRILVLIVILASIIVPVDVPLSLAYPEIDTVRIHD